MAFNPRKLASGTTLGPFVIRDRIGRGATATVYSAEAAETGELIALKVLHRSLGHEGAPTTDDLLPDEEAESADQQEGRLRREIELAHRISHPGICRLFDLHECQGLSFLSMELIVGFNLETVLASGGRLAPARAARIISKVAVALAAAHDQGVVHRDLKPGNIVLRANEEPIVLDFGYATGTDVGRLTRTGVWVGTLSYAAPELLRGEKASASCDLFALGIILYQCLTGELPFLGRTYGEIASALLYHDPTPVGELVAGVSPGLEATVKRALERDPKARFASARELATALTAFAAGDASATPALDERTLTAKHRHHITLLIAGREPSDLSSLEDWGGERVECAGAGVGALFASADDALRAAIALRRAGEQSGELGPQIALATGDAVLRRGLASGDIVEAARELATQAAPSAILLTASTRLSLRNRKLALACQSFVPRRRESTGSMAGAEVFRYAAGGSEKTAIYHGPLPSSRTPPLGAARFVPAVFSEAPTKTGVSRPSGREQGRAVGGKKNANSEPLPTNPAQLRALRQELATKVAAAREHKGIIAGDDLTLDSLERAADLEFKRDRVAQACNCLRSALDELDGLVVDAGFVKQKIQRLDRVFRDRRVYRDMSRFAPMLDGIMASFEAQAFAAANAALNQAFAML